MENVECSLDDRVLSADYHTFFNAYAAITVCCLTLRDGFSVVGEAVCGNPNRVDLKLNRELSYVIAIHRLDQRDELCRDMSNKDMIMLLHVLGWSTIRIACFLGCDEGLINDVH